MTTPSWNATRGVLRRYQDDGGKWKQVGDQVAVVVGRSGLAWSEAGLGKGRIKREGDGRTPAGIFALTEAWGTADAPPAGTRLRYQRSTELTRCVDDGEAAAYNTIVEETPAVVPQWKSAEIMRRSDGLYDWVVVVDHNRERKPGGGSCIFLHVWRDAKSPTVGCTAMDKAKLAELMSWLDPAAARLVVVPASELAKMRRKFPGIR